MLELGLYVGSYRLRTSGGRFYIHVPAKLVSRFVNRKVAVTMQVNARVCPEIHGAKFMFPAMLVKTGDTFRLNIPSKFARLALRVEECRGDLDVWLSPL